MVAAKPYINMMTMRKISLIITAVMLIGLLSACSKGESKIEIEKPHSVATVDEPSYLLNETGSVEASANVNGRRFNMTLYEFTSKYNAEKKLRGDNDLIVMGNWRENGSPAKDNHGVLIQYYYYDDYGVNITASVEVESEKIMNIGVGTTMSNFMAQDEKGNNSDEVLLKTALMAQVACGYDSSKLDTLQNIFYRTTTEANNTLYYDGFVFALSTQEDVTNSKNNVMLFRVFPISEELKKEWKLQEYKEK